MSARIAGPTTPTKSDRVYNRPSTCYKIAMSWASLSTRALRNALRESRVLESVLLALKDKVDESNPESVAAWERYQAPDLASCRGHIEKLKAVLATREHLPNKNERRKIRQERAKNRGRGRVRQRR